MKKTILTIVIVLGSLGIFAQPLPPSGAGHGTGANQPGNGAPLDGGFSIILLIAAAYGGGKIHLLRKKEEKKD